MRIGIDLGGTKTELAALDPAGAMHLRRRVPTPRSYPATIDAIAGLVEALERDVGVGPDTARAARPTVGMGIPGSFIMGKK